MINFYMKNYHHKYSKKHKTFSLFPKHAARDRQKVIKFEKKNLGT